MRDILIGVAIIFCCFLIGDYIYTEKNTCVVADAFSTQECKCGILFKNFELKVYYLERYW